MRHTHTNTQQCTFPKHLVTSRHIPGTFFCSFKTARSCKVPSGRRFRSFETNVNLCVFVATCRLLLYPHKAQKQPKSFLPLGSFLFPLPANLEKAASLIIAIQGLGFFAFAILICSARAVGEGGRWGQSDGSGEGWGGGVFSTSPNDPLKSADTRCSGSVSGELKENPR